MIYQRFREALTGELNPHILSPSLWLPGLLSPDLKVDNFEELSVQHLQSRGIKGVVVDYDGVVGKYHSSEPPHSRKIAKLAELRSHFKICILSNRKGTLLRSLEHLNRNILLLRLLNKRLKIIFKIILKSMSSSGNADNIYGFTQSIYNISKQGPFS